MVYKHTVQEPKFQPVATRCKMVFQCIGEFVKEVNIIGDILSFFK